MKKLITFFFAFLLCLSLAACDQQPMPSETGGTTAGTDNSTTSADTPTTEATAATGIQIGTVDVQTLREGNWNSATVAEGSFDVRFLPAEGGYYYLLDGFLCFYDPSSNVSVILCQKVGCLHEKEENYQIRKACEANLDAGNLFVYDSGYLFYTKDDPGQQLYRRNADGTGMKHIATLCESHIDRKHEARIENCLLSDGALYYTVMVSTVELDKNGTLVSKEVYRALMRLDLSSGKEEELIRISGAGISLVAAKKDAVLYVTSDTASLLEVPPADRVEAMLNTPKYYYLWTKETNASQELLCKLHRESLNVLSFDCGKIVSVESEPQKYYSYDLVTGEQQYIDMPGHTKMNDNLYFNDATESVCDATGKEYPNAFLDLSETEYNDLQINLFAMGDSGVIMERCYRTISGPDEQGAYTTTAKATYYSYVPYEALEDGLQPEDVTDILSWEETYD